MKKRIIVAALAALLSLTSVSVMAATSPQAPTYHKVTIKDTLVESTTSTTVKIPGGAITATTGVVEDGKEVTFTVTEDEGNAFVSFVITGNYTIVSGSLTDKTITIKPTSDVKVDATFAQNEETTTVEEETEEEETTVKPDDSGTSPQTGLPVAGVLVTLLASGAVAVASKKRF